MKNKKISLFSLVVLLTVSLGVPAFGNDEPSFVTDVPGLLTAEQQEDLTKQAAEISDTCGCGVYLAILDDFTKYPEPSDVTGTARWFYRNYELGVGEEKSGVLLLLSMADRDYCLYAYGFGNTAFTDYGKDYLADEFLDNFKSDDWYGGFLDYMTVSARMLDQARSGNPLDVHNCPGTEKAGTYGILSCVVLGFIMAFIVRSFLLGQLKSVKKGTEAQAFVTAMGLKLTENSDRYSRTTQTRVYDPPEKDKGGTTVDDSGGSSKSGKF